MRRIPNKAKLQELEEEKNKKYNEMAIEDLIENLEQQKKLNSQIEELNQVVDKIIEKCDQRKATQKQEFEEEFGIKRQELQEELNKTLKELEELCLRIKNDNDTDYKGIYANLTQKLVDVANESKILNQRLDKINLEKIKLEENLEFYQKQIQDELDLNTYLRIKLKLGKDPGFKTEFFKDKKENLNIKTEESVSLPYRKKDKIALTEATNKIVSTTVSENLERTRNKLYKINRNRKGKLYLTNTDQSSSPYNKSKNKEEDYLEYKNRVYKQIKKYLDLEEKKITNEIKYSNKLQKKKLGEFKSIHNAMTNPFTTILSQKIDDFMNNRLPCINSYGIDTTKSKVNSFDNCSTDLSPNSSFSSFPKYNLSLQNKKDIVISFLENEEIKKYIYESFYQGNF